MAGTNAGIGKGALIGSVVARQQYFLQKSSCFKEKVKDKRVLHNTRGGEDNHDLLDTDVGITDLF